MSTKHSPIPAPAESKVRKYIQNVKKSDAESSRRKSLSASGKRELSISLEELYDVDKETPGQSSSTTDANWNRTLREIKEKDIIILKLRQSVSDLAIKCANAENTIDELRCQRGPLQPLKSTTIKKDVMVETDDNSRILEQQCVDWLEKVQNWRADTVLYSSHEESCGDSGFRGSELELKNTLTTTTATITNTTTIGTSTNNIGGELRIPAQHSNNHTNTSTSKDICHTGSNLDPLLLCLDEATNLAKRVKEKSVRLSQMLSEQQE